MKIYPVILAIFYIAYNTNAISIITKSSWGGVPAKLEINLNNSLNYIVIHHSAGAYCTNRTTCSSQMRIIQSFHMNQRGWDDIGYNYGIGGDGEIYEGCGAGIMGAHALSWNSKSYGIMFIGNYNEHMPTEKQLSKVKELMDWLVTEGYVANNYTVHGHRQVRATECPGNKLYDEIKKWPSWRE